MLRSRKLRNCFSCLAKSGTAGLGVACDRQAHGDSPFQFLDVGYYADHAPMLLQGQQRIYRRVESFAVQRAEALVDEYCFKSCAAAVTRHHVR